MNKSHQLAAIMFTDIVGYTSLMGQSEQHALEAMAANQKVQKVLLEQFNGTWHKDLGDGTLCSFNSTVNAVKCAIAIQQVINGKEDFRLRIGIHLGDVTFSNGDVFGDGVNIASRIETEAAEGGISISESVVRSIKGTEAIKTSYIGKRKLKNVSESIRIYQVVAQDVSTKIKRKKSSVYTLVPIITILMLVSGYIAWVLKPTPAKQVMRFTFALQDNIRRIADIALSNDGKTLIIGAETDGFVDLQMFVRPLNAFESYHIPDGNGIDDPTFLMDDSEVAFGSNGTIKVYSMETGTISDFADALSIQIGGMTWTGDNLVYTPGVGNSELNINLMQISKGESENRVFISPDLEKGELSFSSPYYIPGSNKLLFQMRTKVANSIQLLDINSMQYYEVIEGQFPKLISPGYLLFKDGDNLMGINFNPDDPDVTGKPVLLLTGVESDLFTCSSNGTLVYVESQEADLQPYFVNADGVLTAIPMPKIKRMATPRWSPDESKIVFNNPSTYSLWIYDLDNETSQLLLNHTSNTSVWLPNSKRVAYRSPNNYILSVNILNPNEIDTLVHGGNDIYPVSFSSDGNLMLYDEIHSTDKKNILLYNRKLDESSEFIISLADESMAQFSPDDEWVVYCSNVTGQYEIYVRKFVETGEKWLISDSGGTEPRWSANGKEIYYRNGNRIMSVSIKTSDQVEFGSAEQVLDGPYPPSPWRITNFDVNRDGDKFFMLKPVSSGRKEIHIIVNWFEELKELMSK